MTRSIFSPTFFGDGSGWRFLILSSLIFFGPSLSDRTTKKWLHFSHLINRVEAKSNDTEVFHWCQTTNLQTRLSTCVQTSPHFGQRNVILPDPSPPPRNSQREFVKYSRLQRIEQNWCAQGNLPREINPSFRMLKTSRWTETSWVQWFSPVNYLSSSVRGLSARRSSSRTVWTVNWTMSTDVLFGLAVLEYAAIVVRDSTKS